MEESINTVSLVEKSVVEIGCLDCSLVGKAFILNLQKKKNNMHEIIFRDLIEIKLEKVLYGLKVYRANISACHFKPIVLLIPYLLDIGYTAHIPRCGMVD